MEKPLTYDWMRGDVPVRICVDLNMHVHEAKLHMPWCVYVTIAHPPAKPLLSFLHNPIRKLKKIAGNGCFVAEEVPDCGEYTRYVWYVEDEKAAQVIQEFCNGQIKASLSCDIRHDPKWTTYYDEFYPARAQWQTIHNAELLDLRKREGDDPSRARPVKHNAYFFDDATRQLFLAAAKQSGFAIEDTYFASDHNTKPCGITLRHICEMQKAAIDKSTTTIIRLCEKYGGDYGGWDAAMHRKHARR